MNRLMFNTPCRLKHSSFAGAGRYVRFQMASCLVGLGVVFLAAIIASPFDITKISSLFDRSEDFARSGANGHFDEQAYIRSIAERVSVEHDIPAELLIAVIKVESSFNSRAVSRAGAKGLMQLMPATAAEMNLVNPYDPRENIRAGAGYLSKLIARYNGDWKLALAAYNAGPANVARYGGIPPYKETRQYVQKVLRAYHDEKQV